MEDSMEGSMNDIDIGNIIIVNTETMKMLDKICSDNDYLLTFQARPETKNLATEIVRLEKMTKSCTTVIKSTDLEPLLGYLSAFIISSDTWIAKRIDKIHKIKHSGPIIPDTKRGKYELDEDEDIQYYEDELSYEIDIRDIIIKSRDQLVDYQMSMMLKSTNCI